jgi:hypothetical protein
VPPVAKSEINDIVMAHAPSRVHPSSELRENCNIHLPASGKQSNPLDEGRKYVEELPWVGTGTQLFDGDFPVLSTF